MIPAWIIDILLYNYTYTSTPRKLLQENSVDILKYEGCYLSS